mgnify:CR=1 FL=1
MDVVFGRVIHKGYCTRRTILPDSRAGYELWVRRRGAGRLCCRVNDSVARCEVVCNEILAAGPRTDDQDLAGRSTVERFRMPIPH